MTGVAELLMDAREEKSCSVAERRVDASEKRTTVAPWVADAGNCGARDLMIGRNPVESMQSGASSMAGRLPRIARKRGGRLHQATGP